MSHNPDILIPSSLLTDLVELAHHGLIALEDQSQLDMDSVHPDVIVGGHETMTAARQLLGQPEP